jgi:hypothetical protein
MPTPLAVAMTASAMVLVAFAAQSVVLGDSMTWQTVDGGGRRSFAEIMGETIEFTGTIGQVDASTGHIAGGVYVFTSGFWNDRQPGPVVTCSGDATGDGFIDVTDLLLVIGAWGQIGPNQADVTGDGVVNVSDLMLVIGAWGTCPT